MKKVFLGCLLGLFSFNGLQAALLESEQTTPHLVIQFSEAERDSISALAEELESYYVAISEEYSLSRNFPLHINIYPDIDSFHEAMGFVDAPSWLVATSTSDTIDIVSPHNPGSFHTQESLSKIMKLNLTKSAFFNEFGPENIPYWLAYGIGAMNIDYGDHSHSYNYVPSLSELETTHSSDYREIDGFQVAYAFTKFVAENYGKETLVDLLTNHELRIELYQDWIDSLT